MIAFLVLNFIATNLLFRVAIIATVARIAVLRNNVRSFFVGIGAIVHHIFIVFFEIFEGFHLGYDYWLHYRSLIVFSWLIKIARGKVRDIIVVYHDYRATGDFIRHLK